MQHEIKLLQKQVKRLQAGLLCTTFLFLAFFFVAFTGRVSSFDVIRARGIIIEDSAGRDRILIGAPIPASPHRVRTDTAKVRAHWAKKYGNPDQYMKWYKDYRHSTNGMVVMNEDGFDRVLVGDKLADPNIGKRMFEIAGMLWNDREGWEKGGAGVNTTKDGQSRSIVGVDDNDGEAVHIVALEDGTKGLMIGGNSGQLIVGMAKKNGQRLQNKEAFTGTRYYDSTGKLVWEQQLMKSKQ